MIKASIWVYCPNKGLTRIFRCMKCKYFDSLNPIDSVFCKFDEAFEEVKEIGENENKIIKIIKELEEIFDKGIPETEIIKEAKKKYQIEDITIKEILKNLREEGIIYCPKKEHYLIVWS